MHLFGAYFFCTSHAHIKQRPLHQDVGKKSISRCLFISNHTVEIMFSFFHPQCLAVSFICSLQGFPCDKLTGIVNEHNTCSEQHCSYLYQDAFSRQIIVLGLKPTGHIVPIQMRINRGRIFLEYLSASQLCYSCKSSGPPLQWPVRQISLKCQTHFRRNRWAD